MCSAEVPIATLIPSAPNPTIANFRVMDPYSTRKGLRDQCHET